MGVDYTAFGGIGTTITKEEAEKFNFDKEYLEENGFQDEFNESVHAHNVQCVTAGCAYSGNEYFVLTISGLLTDGFDAVPGKLKAFRKWLDDIGFSDKNIQEIAELHVW